MSKRTSDGVELFMALFSLGLCGAAVAGWVMNIVAIFHSDFSHITGALVLRIIGVPIFIIGAVLGWL